MLRLNRLFNTLLIMGLVIVVLQLPVAAQQNTAAKLPPSTKEKCLKIGMFTDFGEAVTDIAIRVLGRMYSLAGYCMEPVFMPSNRSMRQLMNGDLDGEMARAPNSVDQMGRQAISVPQPMMAVQIQFTWIDGLPFGGTVEDLRGRSIGLLRGLPTVQKYLAAYSDQITLLQNLKSAGELLKRGRIDMLVSGGIGYPKMREDFAKHGIKLRAKPFLEIPAYHVLHISHSEKVAALADALKHMIANGELKSINAEQGLLPAKILP